MKKFLRVLSLILFNVFVVIFILACLFTYLDSDTQVDQLLRDYVFGNGDSGTISATINQATYPTWYSSVDDVLDGNGAVAAAAEAEGAVLLKNDNGALPLAGTDNVDFFGPTAYSPMYSIGGAGSVCINAGSKTAAQLGMSSNYFANTKTDRTQTFYSELVKAGVNCNSALANVYSGLLTSTFSGSEYTDNSNTHVPRVRNENWSDVSGSVNTGTYKTAIYVIGRMSAEDSDTPPHYASTNNYDNDGSTDFLQLTSGEQTILRNLSAKRAGGEFSKLIVIFNMAAPMQQNLDSLYSTYNIDAAVWAGFPGSDGIAGIARLLTGQSSFSGGLSDMWYAGRAYNPSDPNYSNAAASQNTSVVMQEDMYPGYRYAETRYEDYVSGTQNAGTYDYSTCVNYPFGYGLTYADSGNGFSMTLGGTDEGGASVPGIEGNDDPDKNYYTTGTYETKADDGTITRYKRGVYRKYGTGAESYVLDHDLSVKRPEDELRAKGDAPGDYDDLTMHVTVTNNGSVAGKKIVQIYLQQAPYKGTGTVEKAAVELVGYAKTRVLQPGESEILDIEIDANKYFASYDSSLKDADGNTAGGYELDAGTYYLTAASNSHEAVNSILKYKRGNSGASVDTSRMDSTFGAGSASMVEAVEVSEDRAASYEYWTQGGATPVNQLSDVDPNHSNSSTVTFMSRSDWSGTVSGTSYFSLTASQIDSSMATNSTFASTGNNFNGSYSSSDLNKYYPNTVEYADTAAKYGSGSANESGQYEITLNDLIGVEYDGRRGATEDDIRLWNDFLDQLTWDDYSTLLNTGRRQTKSLNAIGDPGTNDSNASNGFQFRFSLSSADSGLRNVGFSYKYDNADENRDQYPTGYPCEGIIASTFNIELAYAVGQAIGEDALWAGISGVYGFGLGLHRNPYHGRTGEYYSDDPYLTGTMGGYETLGCQSKGCYVYNKHFVMNDQDANRNKYNTFAREQVVRELYIRPFEIAIEIGDGMNVMTSFNNVGSMWSGQNYSLMHNILREELGMAGFAVSDWYQTNNMNVTWGLLAGNDLPDGYASIPSVSSDAAYYGAYYQAMRTSAQRIAYVVANSNALNGMSAGSASSYTYSFDPDWYTDRDNLVMAANIIFAVSAVFVIGTTAWAACSHMYSKVKKNPDYKGNGKTKKK